MALVIYPLLMGCGQDSELQITSDQIRVVVDERHPFLRDHSRLCIVTVEGKDITQFPLYDDPGQGVHSNLYRDKAGDFVLIDINGTWYFISAQDGQLLRKQWNWQQPTPAKFLGFYEYDNAEEYAFRSAQEHTEPGIYGFKEPIE